MRPTATRLRSWRRHWRSTPRQLKVMNRVLAGLAVLLLLGPLLAVVLGRPREPELAPIRPPAGAFRPDPLAPISAGATYTRPEEEALYRDAARAAWGYVSAQYVERTGLTNSVVGYSFATLWDIGSTLAAYYSARQLGIIDQADYDRRMTAALRTLRTMPLFDGKAYNKNYQVRSALPAGRNDREPTPGSDGYGWSATDIGRLLVWLRIVSDADPGHAALAKEIVDRLALDQIVREGYLWGGERSSRTGRLRTYQEGRIGYEQYAAAGYALWGHYAEPALHMEQNAQPIEVLGVPLFTDRRGDARLTSEPFMLIGMELGWWSPVWEEVALQVLAAQKARFDRTGQLTMVSEDAVPVAPHFFYYYTLSSEGEPFAVAALTTRQPLPGPRWLSAKAAFAWYSLLPGPYTWRTLQAVAPARDPAIGWGSGVYERDGRPTGGQNVNTAAVILEAALYHARRRPILASVPAAAAERAD